MCEESVGGGREGREGMGMNVGGREFGRVRMG